MQDQLCDLGLIVGEQCLGEGGFDTPDSLDLSFPPDRVFDPANRDDLRALEFSFEVDRSPGTSRTMPVAA
jgi:hypothetical protein